MSDSKPFSILPPPSTQNGPNPAVVAELEAALALARIGRVTSVALVYDDANSGSHIVQRYAIGPSPADTAMILLALEICRLRILQAHVSFEH